MGAATRWRSTRSKARVVRRQQVALARQVEVPQARDPEAQRPGAQHGRQQAPLGVGQRRTAW
jgi:hypothetical protein